MTGNGMTSTRPRVAQVITRFMAGAGWVALSGALALDPAHFEIVFITGEGDGLVTRAREAGHEVVMLPHLRSEIAPADDRRALTDLRACLRGFDVVHTHSSKAGALGRLAAHRLGIGRYRVLSDITEVTVLVRHMARVVAATSVPVVVISAGSADY